MTQDEAIDRFKREYQDFHQISKARCVETRSLLLELGDHAGTPVHECGGEQVRAFMSHLNDQGYEITTIAKKLSIIKPFFGWCWEIGLLDAEQWMQIQRIGAPRGARAKRLPRPYSKRELQRLRQQLDKRWPLVDEKFWIRWRRGTSHYRRVQPHFMRAQIEAIIALALYCGLRRQEIFKASIEDVHYDNAYVVVRHGKGDKFREVPHTKSSRAAIQRWLELRTELDPPNDSLWLSLAWEQVARNPMLWGRFKRILRTVGPWELHRLRHTCGTEWLRHIKRLEIVSKLLGHANIQQTLGYAEIVRDDLHAEVAKAEAKFEEAVA